jgi:hypothetical protein
MFTVSQCMPVLFAFAVTGLLSGCGTAQVSSDGHAAASMAAPSISQQPQNTRANDGSRASFTVVASGSAPLTYQWMQNEQPVPRGTGTTLRSAAAALADSSAHFSVIIRNNADGLTSSSATLTVNAVAPSVVRTKAYWLEPRPHSSWSRQAALP